MKPKLCCHIQYGTFITTLFVAVAKPRTCIRYFRSTNVALSFVLKYTKEPQTNREAFLFAWYIFKPSFRKDKRIGKKKSTGLFQTATAELRVDCKLQNTQTCFMTERELVHHNYKYQSHISIAVPSQLVTWLTVSGLAAVTPVCTRSLRLLFGWKLFWTRLLFSCLLNLF